MAESTNGPITLPMRAVDRMNKGNRLSTLQGPMALPPRAEFVDAMVRLAELGPHTRAGLRFSDDGKSWVYDRSRLRELCEAAVTEVSDEGPAIFDQAMHDFSLAGDEVPPLRFILTPHHLIMLIDHGLGDAGIETAIPYSILRMVAGDPAPSWTTWASMDDPLPKAVVNTFVRHPRHVLELLRAERSPAGLSDHVPGPINTSWTRTPAYANATIPDEDVARLRVRVKANPSVSFTGLIVVLVHRALVRAGFPVNDSVNVIHDLRRFLPKGTSTMGNFITGLPVSMAADAKPDVASISAEIVTADTSHRSLAVTALGALRGWTPPEVTPPHLNPELKLSISNAGPMKTVNDLPWTSSERVVTYAVGPTPPEQLSILTAVSGGGMTLTASYDAGVFPRETIEAAMEYAAHHALELLDELEEGALDGIVQS
jgi:hypothetical protein